METAKIAISINKETLKHLDQLVKDQIFPSRSKVFQDAVEEKLRRMKRTRLAEECAKLDSNEEKAMAEEGLSSELDLWPEY